MTKPINWNSDKNLELTSSRNISFEEVVFYLDNDGLIDDTPHPNFEKYPNQRIFVVLVNNYVYLVPYVENDNEIFLKTIIPSRKATKQYLKVIKNEKN